MRFRFAASYPPDRFDLFCWGGPTALGPMICSFKGLLPLTPPLNHSQVSVSLELGWPGSAVPGFFAETPFPGLARPLWFFRFLAYRLISFVYRVFI